MNKRITSLLFSSILLATPMSIHAQYHSQVWNPDNGNGTYTNPVIYADYSDPDVVAVGEDYYLTASSFNCIPGLPILHSKDLVNWGDYRTCPAGTGTQGTFQPASTRQGSLGTSHPTPQRRILHLLGRPRPRHLHGEDQRPTWHLGETRLRYSRKRNDRPLSTLG